MGGIIKCCIPRGLAGGGDKCGDQAWGTRIQGTIIFFLETGKTGKLQQNCLIKNRRSIRQKKFDNISQVSKSGWWWLGSPSQCFNFCLRGQRASGLKGKARKRSIKIRKSIPA